MSAKTLLTAILCFVFAVTAQVVSAQDRTVTGRVTDSKDGSPVSGHPFNPRAPKQERLQNLMEPFPLM